MLTKHHTTAVLSLLMASVLGIGTAQARQGTQDAAGRSESATERRDGVGAQLPQSREGALTEQFRGDERVGGHGALETHGFVWSRVRR